MLQLARAVAIAGLVAACGNDGGDDTAASESAMGSEESSSGEPTGAGSDGSDTTGSGPGCGPLDLDDACAQYCGPWLACTVEYATLAQCAAECIDGLGSAALGPMGCFQAWLDQICCVAELECPALEAWAGGDANAECVAETEAVERDCGG